MKTTLKINTTSKNEDDLKNEEDLKIDDDHNNEDDLKKEYKYIPLLWSFLYGFLGSKLLHFFHKNGVQVKKTYFAILVYECQNYLTISLEHASHFELLIWCKVAGSE